MKKNKNYLKIQNPGTRDAVETAIDMSRDDKKSSWEGRIANFPVKIKSWNSLLSPKTK